MRSGPSLPGTEPCERASGERISAFSHALVDLREILSSRAEYFGEDDSHLLEEDFLAAFERLATTPGLGHRRIDLTSRPYFFYLNDPYFIVYLRNVDPLPVIAVLHSARDVRKLLRKRQFAG